MKSKFLFLIIILVIILFSAGVPKITQAALGEGTLIKGLSDKVYVIESGLKRWIKTAKIFNKLSYSWANILSVSETLLGNTPPGKDITSSYKYPEGTLLKGDGPPVYLVEKGERRWIPNPQIFTAKGFKWRNIIPISDKLLNRIKKDQDISWAYNPSSQRPQTFILDGPCKEYWTTIPEINAHQVEFGYSGRNNEGNATNLKFETFLVGYDTSWKSSWSSYKRKITLPAGNKTYTFYVRAKTKDNDYDITPAFCKFTTNLSPFYEQVEISSVWGRSDNPTKERITLRADSKLSQGINITDWTISTGKVKLTIPEAVKIVHPESMYHFQKDLILEPGEKITIYGGPSPIGIKAYKTNTCLKYYDDENEYKDCFYENNQYPNFFKKEWQIYLNRTSEFLANKDAEIILKDENNLVIDRYSY